MISLFRFYFLVSFSLGFLSHSLFSQEFCAMVYTISGVRLPHLASIKKKSSLPSFNDDRRTNAVTFSLRKDTRSSSGTPSILFFPYGTPLVIFMESNVWIFVFFFVL